MNAGRARLPWQLLALAIALPTVLPLSAALFSFTHIDAELWSHLSQYLLPRVVPQTVLVVAGASLGAGLLGTSLAVLVALHEFPGKRFFSWALVLPLAIPGYVLATVFIGALDYAGGVSSFLRSLGLALPPVRNTGGVIVVLTATLYPYVYLVVRSSLVTQGARVMEAARTLGLSHRQSLWKVALPLSLPAIVGGTLLVAMESLADFGTVAAFNVDTLTTAIYKAWFSLFSIDAALQVAGVLLLFVLVLLFLQQRFVSTRASRQSGPPVTPLRLRGLAAGAACVACALVWGLGFGLPLLQLLAWAVDHLAAIDGRLAWAAFNSLRLGALAALLLCGIAVLLAYAARRAPGLVTVIATRTATLGYALPGALLAVGLFVPLAAFSHWLNGALDTRIALQGGVLTMLVAYAVRFVAVAHAPVASGLGRIKPSLDEAARLADCTGLAQLRRVHLPLLRPSVAAAAALVLVDVMKEMPITLMMRPFGWDTLSVRVFEFTSEGHWQAAALPSLAILFVGLVPVWWVVRKL